MRTLFKNHLLENGVDEKHIIEMAFDLYYFLLDEVQLLDEVHMYPLNFSEFMSCYDG